MTLFDYLKERATANPHIAQHCAFGPLLLEVRSDDALHFITVDAQGVRISSRLAVGVPDLTLCATDAAWAELAKPEPAPGFQTLSTMRRTQNLVVTGNMVKFQQHLLLLEMLFSTLSDDAQAPVFDDPVIEPLVGRYLRLMFQGRAHRIYFEEAGEGVPMICLHTAGSDARQYRHLLNDSAVTDRFRVIAFDLPWHGKSSPPQGFQNEVYELTTEGYVDIVMAIVDALKLENPVVMGCSIGGRAVLHLALRQGDRFRAAIGLQSALYAEDRSLGDPLPTSALHRPDVHGGKSAGASMAGMTAPQSPAAERWETMWHYMQGGPGVFKGDLNYYFKDGDLRNGLVESLRNGPCPIYLLSGDYDMSATPEMGRELAELIGAAHFEVMRGVGHFPMSENPGAFRRYLLPVLNMILA